MFGSNKTLRLIAFVLVLFVCLGTFTVIPTAAQRRRTKPTASTAASQQYSAALAAIEKAIDQKRQELGIPGASLVIVKDDRVVYIKGLGVKDFERKLPVTPDTLFAIGSASKAFTAMIAVMAADENKLSLADSPKKFLPYFKLRDPESDAKITIRDLLSHRSGLNRTDLAMVTGVLNRQELIQVAAMAKPTAKLGEKFQYQNVMYTAAGEAVARAENSTWDKLIETRIFRPLGMRSSDTTVPAMQKARDFSFGYDYNATTKVTRRLPQREIGAAAPAGAINSNARDMSQWLRFMLSGGVINGKRLVSEKGFNEIVSKQMNVAGSVDYGLGWFLRQWSGHKVLEHGGNIDGFNSQVALMPDQKLGFVLLTNVTASTLGAFAMTTVWKNLVAVPPAEAPATGPAADPKQEIGSYKLEAAGVTFEVTLKDGKLVLTVPGQPPYPLESLGGRRYKLAEPAPPGFFVTFRPVKEQATQTELFLEQPQGNLVLKKATPAAVASVETASGDPLKDLVGSYESDTLKRVLEIGVRDGKISLIVPGQPAYPLTEAEKNKLRSPGLPESYWVDVKRDDGGKVSGIVLNQPEGRFSFRRLSSGGLLSADELLAKMIVAYGGEESIRKHKSSVTTVELDMESQGVQGHGSISARAPNQTSSDMTITALGKKLGSIATYFDGAGGGEVISFAPEEVYSGRRLEDIKTSAAFYDVVDWKKNYKTITVKRMAKVGDEDVYVVERKNEKGTPVTDYVSAKSFLVLKRESLIVSETSSVEIPQTEVFSDYRLVDGVMIPFKAVSSNIANGDIVMLVKEVKFDVEIPDSAFQKPAKK
jgi:CubicO group peptidase (beta-lactamase class C family)